MPIRTYPDPVLKEKARPVSIFTPQLRETLNNMAETMYRGHGIGLAANQVGLLERIIVIDISEESNGLLYLVNPEIIWREGSTTFEEGCLSIPDFRETVKRAKRIAVRAQDPEGVPFEFCADGLFAICIQHEIDHLDGILFADRLSRLKKEFFRRWCDKNLAATGTD